MKALIITTQYVNNYGAVLQSYAFHNILCEVGINHVFLQRSASDRVLYKPVFPINRTSLYFLKCNLLTFAQIKNLKRRIFRFDDFRNLLPQTRIYYSEDEIRYDSALSAYDVYITGGDQMFNRTCLTQTSNLLEFVSPEKIRMSYSTSSGNDVFSEEESKHIAKSLSKYKFVSLREENFVTQICRNNHIPYCINYDSTLLVPKESWDIVAKKYNGLPSKYILVYELLQHKNLWSVVEKTRKLYKLPVVVISALTKTTVNAKKIIKDAGPAEFLWIFKNAEAVITTSFHGTCFSIVYEKPFVSLIQRNEKRVTGLLDDLGLADHYSIEDSKLPIKIDNPTRISSILSQERIRVIELLKGKIYE